MSGDFWNSYESGFVFQGFHRKNKNPIRLEYSELKIMYATKINALEVAPRASIHDEIIVYNPIRNLSKINGITISIKVFDQKRNHLEVSDRKNRDNLIKYAYNMASKMLGVTLNSRIVIQDKMSNISDCELVTVIILAMNELFGNPLAREEVMDYIISSTSFDYELVRRTLGLDQIIIKRTVEKEDIIEMDKKSIIAEFFHRDIDAFISKRIIVKNAPYNLRVDKTSNDELLNNVYKCSFFVSDSKK